MRVNPGRSFRTEVKLSQTYSQGGAAAAMGLTSLLIRGAAGHEGPLDGSFWGLCEGESPRDLEHNKYFSSFT